MKNLNSEQWESLCDGCGRCCMCKFEDCDSGEMLYTDIACALFDEQACRCRDYAQRQHKVADCLDIRHLADDQFRWLPASCSYRLLHEGKALPQWHPLMGGDLQAVHREGVSVRGKVFASSEGMDEAEVVSHIITPC
ncbi:MAG: YcgN family cysteine cluster protein [Mariprofundales bacterium]|nr:YcgN family cysteine cluster protein [Mariprofundales bacterium]